MSTSVYPQMGRSSAYIPRRGFDKLQKEQMIVKYIKTNGSITRTQTAELCRINGKSASYLLSKLVRRGLLVKMGIGGRGALYTLNEDANIPANLLDNSPYMGKYNQKNKKIIPSNIQEKSQQIKETKSEQSI
jgi:spore coat protein CotH